MERRAIILLGGYILLFMTVGLIGLSLFRTEAALVSSSLTNNIAVVAGADNVLARTAYDETFLDPHSKAVTVAGTYWRGTIEIHQRADPYVHLLALTAPDSQLTAECRAPTESVGIQFWGDDNDGLAEVVIDDDFVWQRHTGGLQEYVEFTALSLEPHTIRIRPVAADQSNNSGHVTVAGISCLQRGPVMSRIQRLFLPFASR